MPNLGDRNGDSPGDPVLGTIPLERRHDRFTLLDYRPNRLEPIDGWYQAANSSNVATTKAIIEDWFGRPSMIIDPFAGAGSSGVVARQLDVPFFGVELDPVLACVTLAKIRATEADAKQLPELPGIVPIHDPVIACLDLVRQVREGAGDPLEIEIMLDDLRQTPPSSGDRVVIQGDSTAQASWSTMLTASGIPLIYCSPPFGASSPRPAVVARTTRRAESILKAAGLSRSPGPVGTFKSYASLVSGMLRQVEAACGTAWVIIEHEPSDHPLPAERDAILATVTAQTALRGVRVLELGTFSSRGMLSLIVGKVSRGEAR